MSRRREVRVSEVFFEELDRQLGAERGPDGEPSATDFLVIVLPAIVEQFSKRFDDLPEVVTGLTTARMFIGTSALVKAYVVHALAISDGAVEVEASQFTIEEDLTFPEPRPSTLSRRDRSCRLGTVKIAHTMYTMATRHHTTAIATTATAASGTFTHP